MTLGGAGLSSIAQPSATIPMPAAASASAKPSAVTPPAQDDSKTRRALTEGLRRIQEDSWRSCGQELLDRALADGVIKEKNKTFYQQYVHLVDRSDIEKQGLTKGQQGYRKGITKSIRDAYEATIVLRKS